VDDDRYASMRGQCRAVSLAAAAEIEKLVKTPGSLAPRDSIGWLIRNSLHAFVARTDRLTDKEFLEGWTQ
jgi:hypothetical protein